MVGTVTPARKNRRWKQRPKQLGSSPIVVFGSTSTMTPREARRRLAAIVRDYDLEVVGWEPLEGGGITFLISRSTPAVRQ